MSYSHSIPPIVQIRRDRLLGLIGVAVVALASLRQLGDERNRFDSVTLPGADDESFIDDPRPAIVGRTSRAPRPAR